MKNSGHVVGRIDLQKSTRFKNKSKSLGIFGWRDSVDEVESEASEEVEDGVEEEGEGEEAGRGGTCFVEVASSSFWVGM